MRNSVRNDADQRHAKSDGGEHDKPQCARSKGFLRLPTVFRSIDRRLGLLHGVGSRPASRCATAVAYLPKLRRVVLYEQIRNAGYYDSRNRHELPAGAPISAGAG